MPTEPRTPLSFSAEVLAVDVAHLASTIEGEIRKQVFDLLKKRGAVLGLSGGIDSSVTAALCVRALGAERVLGLLMPERESAGQSLSLGRMVADSLGIRTELEEIGPILEAAGCYRRRDDAIRKVIPEYAEGYKCKIVLPSPLGGAYPLFSVVVQSPTGATVKTRLTADAYLGIVAATNFKQRTRKMMEYYWADRLNFAVAGTPNRLEYDQGFFVKNGDGAADLKPIAHLYKTQVYQLAEYLGIPEEILRRPPTTDTYSLAQSQEEFFFAFDYRTMDLLLYARTHAVSTDEVASVVGLRPDQVEEAFRMIDSRRRATAPLHWQPLLAEQIEGVS